MQHPDEPGWRRAEQRLTPAQPRVPSMAPAARRVPVPDGVERPDGGRRTRAAGQPRPARSLLLELPVLIVVALVIALVIKSFVVQAFFIPTGSMQNTLEIGDKVLVNKLVYHFRSIEPGDIVVFDGDGTWNAAPAQPASRQRARAAVRRHPRQAVQFRRAICSGRRSGRSTTSSGSSGCRATMCAAAAPRAW